LKTAGNILSLLLLLLLLSWWGVSSRAFFNSDTGLRFWQAQELVANNWQTFAINYPGRGLDPGLEFIPLYCAYAVLGDEVFFSITPFLPLLASFFYAWLGLVGLTIVPVLAGVLTAVGAYKLARLARVPRPYLILWSSLIATPLLFYTIQLWDHSLAMACTVWAVYGVAFGILKQRWLPVFGAGLIIAFGVGQRPEMYLMAFALGLALLVLTWPRLQLVIALATGGMAGMLPLWWLQYQWIGHPFGILLTHISDYGRPDSFAYDCIGPPRSIQAGRFLLYIEGRDPWSFTAALLVIIGLFLLIFWLRLPSLQNNKVAVGGLIMAIIGYAIWGSMLWRGVLAGLLTTFPLLALSLTYVDKQDDTNPQRPVYRLVLWAGLLFLGGMLLIWPAYGGNHFGARYLLPVYPLLLFLAFYVYYAYAANTSLQDMVRIVGATLLIMSILLQLLGLRLFWQQTAENQAIQASLATLPAEVILTNHPFLPTMLRGLDDQFFMYVDSEADFETLIPRFAEAGISHFAFVAVAALPLDVPEQVGDIEVRQLSPVLYALEPPSWEPGQ
jgi:hypothetical protein